MAAKTNGQAGMNLSLLSRKSIATYISVITPTKLNRLQETGPTLSRVKLLKPKPTWSSGAQMKEYSRKKIQTIRNSKLGLKNSFHGI